MKKGLCNYTGILTVVLTLVNLNLLGQTINTAGCDCDYVVEPDQLYVDGTAVGVGPGDVVCVAASTKRYLGFINFHGSPGNPIIIKNCGGQVIIRDTDWYYGIKLDNCSYFRFTGTGSPGIQYGFLVDGTLPQIAGLGVAKMSTDIEIDHIEISRAGFAGIIVKSDPDCTGLPNRENFTQRNTNIHDNYVHDVGGEGLYIGFAHYRGIIRECGADSIRVLPHELIGVKIYNNRIFNTGKEGLQVGCAISDVDIYGNSIIGFGLNNSKYQWAGVHLSTGTTGKFHNNYIVNGMGPGMWLNAHGDNFIFNNVFANVGISGQDGIMIHDSIVADGKGYNIMNNTFVNAGGNGMKVYTERNTMLNFSNNIVAGAGGELFSVPPSVVFMNNNNIMDHNPNNIQFEDLAGGNYHLKQNSPAVDAGMDMSAYGVISDYEYIFRPRGREYDAGAYESPFERNLYGFFIYPNPIYSVANIKFMVPEDTEGSLKIYDVFGRVVGIVTEGPFEAEKEYEFEFDSFYLAQGIYYYTLEANDKAQVIKVLLVE